MSRNWPTHGKKLFIEEGNYYEFSHIGWGSLRIQFSGYMNGYKQSADTLIIEAIKSKDISKLDTFIYPICFLYRQYLELEMKNILIYYCSLNKKRLIKKIEKSGHSLLVVWNKIEEFMLEEATKKDKESIKAARSYIEQFHDFDRTSFKFRYPVDKFLNKTLETERKINLINLMDCMEDLDCFFSGVTGKLDEIKEWKCELMTNLL